MLSWKLIFLRFAGFGAGAAIALCVVAGTWHWYASRPKPPKPWNRQAITAEFDDIGTTHDTNELTFVYIVRNNTDFDFKLDEENARAAVKFKSKEAFGFSQKNLIKIEYPVFVPAKSGALVSVRLLYLYPHPALDVASATPEELQAYRKEVSAFVSDKMHNLGGFVLFDGSNRYEVDFPDGWDSATAKKREAPKNEVK